MGWVVLVQDAGSLSLEGHCHDENGNNQAASQLHSQWKEYLEDLLLCAPLIFASSHVTHPKHKHRGLFITF